MTLDNILIETKPKKKFEVLQDSISLKISQKCDDISFWCNVLIFQAAHLQKDETFVEMSTPRLVAFRPAMSNPWPTLGYFCGVSSLHADNLSLF